MVSGGQPINIQLETDKKAYFSSDHHFGAPNEKDSLVREKLFVKWLDEIKDDCGVLFLIGDLFDFWFEYKHVVPKGFVRVLGKLAEISDRGIPIYFFVGNHDLWMKDYLEEQINAIVFRDKQDFIINGKDFFIVHGDGKGPGDKGYKRMKKVFTNKVCQFLFYLLHPDLAMWLGITASRKNKMISGDEDVNFLGVDNEWLIMYSRKQLHRKYYDYLVYGHRHLPMEIAIGKARHINLGDWINYFTYGVFDGKEFELKTYLRDQREESRDSIIKIIN
ncbi:UDP-2,3-diacylglucosamine diphosphatase [Empedobacter tilapiae]|uniref:UDP-2,3-diacylglucosamine diphosphatase n=1 Tax=Empedobacter tilapiae TaxID=2491114 RepID=A0A4Z1BLP0_9FLAO|nr:UDP-2,3-diacylglucosamine diphosphatase [Empedobacter tilapiae]TGN26660.1 UDP-2,3-diacylglucosamine diphosphatase [Empedobacter tilapiae]